MQESMQQKTYDIEELTPDKRLKLAKYALLALLYLALDALKKAEGENHGSRP